MTCPSRLVAHWNGCACWTSEPGTPRRSTSMNGTGTKSSTKSRPYATLWPSSRVADHTGLRCGCQPPSSEVAAGESGGVIRTATCHGTDPPEFFRMRDLGPCTPSATPRASHPRPRCELSGNSSLSVPGPPDTSAGSSPLPSEPHGLLGGLLRSQDPRPVRHRVGTHLLRVSPGPRVRLQDSRHGTCHSHGVRSQFAVRPAWRFTARRGNDVASDPPFAV